MTDAKRRPTALVVGTLCVAGLTCALMQTLVIPMFPELPSLLDVNTEDASWLITATVLATAVATPTLSRLADMYGKRRMILVSLAAMLVGSVLGAFSQSLTVLIAARVLQGISIALIPIGISIMRDELPRERLSTGVALMSSTIGVGAAVGLPLSGFIFEHLGWHALFWISGIAAIALIVAVLAVVPESPVRSGGRFDVLGAITLSIALAVLLLGITKGGHWGWTDPLTVLCFAGAAVLLCLWVPWELRTRDALVDLRISTRRTVMLTNIATFIVGLAMYCNLITSTTLLQMPHSTGYGFGLTVLAAGLVMAPGALTMFVFAPVASRVIQRWGPRICMALGCAFLAAGYLYRIIAINTVWEVAVGAVIVSTGTLFAYSATPMLIMSAVPVNETAAANGVNAVARSVGMASASAMVAALITTVTINVGDAIYPALEAFRYVYVIAGSAAVIAGIVTLCIRSRVSVPAALVQHMEAPAR